VLVDHFLLKPRGTVYTAVLNFRGGLEALGGALHQDPYKKPPVAPVLFIKPPNTWAHNGEVIPCPVGVDQLRMGGTLAVVIGRTASRVDPDDALRHVVGYTIANDVSIPHESYYRPPIAQRCRDGFCPIAARIRPLPNPDRAEIRISVNGRLRASTNTANLVRSVQQLIADVTEFMTLNFGDVLLVGEPENAPLAKVGDTVRVEIEGLGGLENAIVSEEAAR
jgi:5-oxopent-3-ene-1,2,5-tricarboxylate decarboxylase / 2-hydroxyhepta-2,4-diene-1,7-dioate isomerase